MQLCDFEVGPTHPFFLIAGPCVIESEQLAMDTAGHLKELTTELQIPFIYKSSFDKANRTSHNSFRGPGIDAGLKILADVKEKIGVPVLTDIHEDTPLDEVANVVDVLQTPAFLCRQTNYIEKARAVGNDKIMVCERGSSFGYNYLVSDMRSLIVMQNTGAPVVFDATHSVQMPGGGGDVSAGQREFVPALARAAMAVGISGLFMETHPEPEKALSDGPNSWPLDKMKPLLETLKTIDQIIK